MSSSSPRLLTSRPSFRGLLACLSHRRPFPYLSARHHLRVPLVTFASQFASPPCSSLPLSILIVDVYASPSFGSSLRWLFRSTAVCTTPTSPLSLRLGLLQCECCMHPSILYWSPTFHIDQFNWHCLEIALPTTLIVTQYTPHNLKFIPVYV